MGTRKEHDFIGELEISDEVYYGVQTFRAVEKFQYFTREAKGFPTLCKSFSKG